MLSSMMRSVLRDGARAVFRARPCRRGMHAWTEMAYPTACALCGRRKY